MPLRYRFYLIPVWYIFISQLLGNGIGFELELREYIFPGIDEEP
jgi:hypothetical protein